MVARQYLAHRVLTADRPLRADTKDLSNLELTPDFTEDWLRPTDQPSTFKDERQGDASGEEQKRRVDSSGSAETEVDTRMTYLQRAVQMAAPLVKS